jgi:hypothetical protein
MVVPNFTLLGFDEWCRIRSGLSNASIAKALSVDVDTVEGWREGHGIPDPSVTLLPLQIALKTPWPPATAEETWRELLQMIASAKPETAPRKRTPKSAPKVEAPKAKAEPAAPKVDAVLLPILTDLEAGAERLAPAVLAAEQTSLGWFARNLERYKKYVTKRDTRHRKACLGFLIERAEALLEKARGRREDLQGRLGELKEAVDRFETLRNQCSDKLGRKIDENIGLWRELQKAAPIFNPAQQACERATNKTLAGLEDAITRGEATVADWTARQNAIAEEAVITLSWVTRDSALGERLEHSWQKRGGSWPEGFDPFDGECICKDKLADSYRVGTQFNHKNPPEIDIAQEIDLTVVGLQRRQEKAREVAAGVSSK